MATGAPITAPINIGSRAGPTNCCYQFNGEVAEVLLFDGVVASEEFLKTQTYLMEKYGIV